MALIWKWWNESIDGHDGSLFPRSLLRASQIAKIQTSWATFIDFIEAPQLHLHRRGGPPCISCFYGFPQQHTSSSGCGRNLMLAGKYLAFGSVFSVTKPGLFGLHG